MHGPTFMGNALACVVALKGIEIFERDDYMSKNKRGAYYGRLYMYRGL